jgi:hypothetical protein
MFNISFILIMGKLHKKSNPARSGLTGDMMGLCPHMALIKEWIVLCQMAVEVLDTFSSIHYHAHINQLMFGMEPQQPAPAEFWSHILDDDLGWTDTCRRRDLRLEGCPDAAHVVGEAGVARVERDGRRNLLGVGALEACHAAAVEERRAALVRRGMSWTLLLGGGVCAEASHWTVRTVCGPPSRL